MPSFVEIDQEILILPSFTLECGETLREVPVAYKTWGELNEKRDNVMIICHAFTGSSDVEDWYAFPFSFPVVFFSHPLILSLSSLFYLSRTSAETFCFSHITMNSGRLTGGVR